MYAIVGVPGSQWHTYRHFSREDRRAAENWAAQQCIRIERDNPAVVLQWKLLSDRDAARIRWRDGRRIYPAPGSEEYGRQTYEPSAEERAEEARWYERMRVDGERALADWRAEQDRMHDQIVRELDAEEAKRRREVG